MGFIFNKEQINKLFISFIKGGVTFTNLLFNQNSVASKYDFLNRLEKFRFTYRATVHVSQDTATQTRPDRLVGFALPLEKRTNGWSAPACELNFGI
jgi:hypothetical protein